jgi:hypothetical protein
VADRTDGEHPLPVKATAAAIGAAAGLVGIDAAVAGAALTPVIEEVLGQLYSGMTARRVKRVTETLAGAAEELGSDAAEQLTSWCTIGHLGTLTRTRCQMPGA